MTDKQINNAPPRPDTSDRKSWTARFAFWRRPDGPQRKPGGRGLGLRIRKLKAPSVPFDPAWYASQLPKSLVPHGNLRRHYIRWGAERGLSPHPLFDPAWYLAQLPAPPPEDLTALEHFLQEGRAWGYSPHPLFDSRWYLDEYPDVEEAGANPLAHFLTSGADEGRKPNPYFDPLWYRSRHLPSAARGLNPLIHYALIGAAQDFEPSTLFDARWYRATNQDVAEMIDGYGGSLAHFMAEGIGQGRAAGPSQSLPNIGGNLAGDGRGQAGPAYQPRSNRPRPRKLPIKVLVVSSNMEDCAWARSSMLAQATSRVVRDIVLINLRLDRSHGATGADPRREACWPAVDIDATDLAGLFDAIHHVASVAKPDIVVASVSSLPALLLGLSLRERSGCRLVLDIDGEFAQPGSDISTAAELERLLGTTQAPHATADGTWRSPLLKALLAEADGVITSGTDLQRRFGGAIVPSAASVPESPPNRHEARERLGIPDAAGLAIILASSSTQAQLREVIRAIESIGEDFRALIIDASLASCVSAEIESMAAGRITMLPRQSSSAYPDLMAAADLVVLPREESEAPASLPFPAEAVLAMAMAVPLLISGTDAPTDLLESGAVRLIDYDRLPAQFVDAWRDRRSQQPITAIDGHFLAQYSDQAVATTLRDVLSHAMSQPMRNGKNASTQLLAPLRRPSMSPQSTRPAPTPSCTDIIVFWKQNDTTLYGRRHDMVIKYLASHADVRRVIVFDLPISIHDLNKLRDASAEQASEYRHIYVRTRKKDLELMDTEKISYRSFIHHPNVGHVGDSPSPAGPSSLQDSFRDFVASVFDRENVRADEAIFWVYPRNPFIEPLVETFRPRRVVVDVVDDHRAWPGVTDEQKAELTEHYRAVLALADFSFANCEPVAAAMRSFSPTIQLIPNGCEVEPAIQEPVRSAFFDAFTAWPGKVIGYVGNLEEKIDLDLLHKLAHAFPNCLIALLGSTHANPATRELAQHANILMPGVVPYDEIGAWVSHFSVGIIPHRNIDLTQSMNPLKLFVYAAHGVPVVATNIPNLSREWTGLSVAVDHDDFLYQMRARLKVDDNLGKRSEFVLNNSWDSRLKKIVSTILEI